MKLAVMGATGRMGRALLKEIISRDDLELAGGIDRPGHDLVGQDLGQLAGGDPIGIPLTDDALALIARVDGVVDFTSPASSVEYAGLAAQARIVHVLGTTGLSEDDQRQIKAASRHATVIQSGNMSLGINLLAALTKQVAATLDPSWDIEIVEMHHRHKADAPSGTALLLGEAAAQGRNVELSSVSDTKRLANRDGVTGARIEGDIGFASLRGGSVVGEHTVLFASTQERIELKHVAEDRQIFVRGALTAALWGQDKGPGHYTMSDVLGL